MSQRALGLSAVVVMTASFATFGASARAYAPGNPSVVSDTQAALDPYGATLSPPQVPLDTSTSFNIQPNTQIEPSIAVNPADPSDVVTDFQIGRVDPGGDANNGFATTLTGGGHSVSGSPNTLVSTTSGSWTYGAFPSLTKNAPGCIGVPSPTLPGCAFDRASDAVVTFGRDPRGAGNGYKGYDVYANSLVFDDQSQNGLPSGMAVNVSYDGGLTWSNAVILEQDSGGGLNDKNWMVADNAPSPNFDCPTTVACHHPGRVYVVWDRVASIEYTYCDPDNALVGAGTNPFGCENLGNWSNIQGNGFYTLFPGQGIGTQPIILNDGNVGVMFESLTANPCPPPTNPLEQPSCLNPSSAGSSNIEFGILGGAGGTTWPAPIPLPKTWAPVTVAQYLSAGIEDQRAGTLPQVAYDANTGDVFVGWEDNRFRQETDASCVLAPPNGFPCSQQNDAVISVSHVAVSGQWSPVGLTWSTPVPVNHDPGSTTDESNFVDHWNTMIAVGTDGILRVGYRQRYEPNGMPPTAAGVSSIDTYYQESRDHGVTFSTPLLVNTSIATDPQFGAFSRNGLFLGDYQELAAGGNDETYVTRDESFAPSGASSCLRNFSSFPTDTGGTAIDCQNQTTFVAHLLPQNSAATPEVRFVPALLVVGGGVVAWAIRRRRRRDTIAP